MILHLSCTSLEFLVLSFCFHHAIGAQYLPEVLFTLSRSLNLQFLPDLASAQALWLGSSKFAFPILTRRIVSGSKPHSPTFLLSSINTVKIASHSDHPTIDVSLSYSCLSLLLMEWSCFVTVPQCGHKTKHLCFRPCQLYESAIQIWWKNFIFYHRFLVRSASSQICH